PDRLAHHVAIEQVSDVPNTKAVRVRYDRPPLKAHQARGREAERREALQIVRVPFAGETVAEDRLAGLQQPRDVANGHDAERETVGGAAVPFVAVGRDLCPEHLPVIRLNEHAGLHKWASSNSRFFTVRSSSTSVVSKLFMQSSGQAFGPSDFACAGSGCVSMNSPATPVATAARASTGTNSRCPPELVPCPPGS